MKNILTLVLVLFSLQFVYAQGPGGVSLSSNNLWVSADYGLTLDASNGVEVWENRMGIANLNMLGIGANKPTYVASDINGLPTISFDGTVLLESSGYLGSSYFPTSDASVFIVTSNNDLGNASVIYGTYPLSTTRFASHLSWSNAEYYFDIGVCCTPRIQGTYASAGATTNAYYIWGYTANSSANLLSAYLDNLEIKTNSQTGTFTDHSTKKFQFGGQGEDPYGFDGDIAEFILFNEAVNAAQRTVINNYLSSKYNLTITDDYYADATYIQDVIGIGTSDGTLKHAASVNGSSGLGLAESGGTLDAATEYLFAGHDNTTNVVSTADLGTGVEERWLKDWTIDKTGTLDAQISFDFSEGINGLYPQNSADYELLIWGGATYDIVTSASKSISGDKIIFDVTDGNLSDGIYTLGTTDKTASPVFGKSLRKWYSYQSGNWADPLTWTLDGGGTPIYDNGSAEVPTADDIVIITSGRTVTIQSTTNNIDISEFQVVGQLNLTTSTGHTFNKISGNGIITTTAATDNFPDGDASDFANTSIGGTFIVNGTGITLGTDREFNELQINLTSTSDIAIMASDYIVNGALTITNGIFQINDNSNTAQLNITVEDLTVGANGKITVGTASTIGTFLIAGTLPTVGNYHAIYHRINIYGDFTNDGTVKFTNQSVPDYNELYAGGAATVYFKGDGDNTTTLNGPTDFYNLVVDKGDDQSYVLEINSSSAANFTLFGANSASWNSTSPYSTTNPEVRKALWIKNGTLKLTGTMLIPTLTEGGNSDGEYLIADNGALWIASANVELRSTAITTDSEVVGHTGVTDGTTDNESFFVYGKFRISDGLFSSNNSRGIVYSTTSFAEILIEGGIVNISKFRSSGGVGSASYAQSGGIVTLSGISNNGHFDFEGTGVIFNMSGGEIILDEGDFLVGATAGNYSVTGGKVTYNMSEGTVINSTANLWDLQLQSQTTDNRRLRLNNDLVVSNDLTIKAYARLDSDDNGGGIFDLTIGADFTIETGGSTTKYYANTNTTTIDGTKISNLNFADLVTFNNLTINKSDASQLIEIDNGAATAIQIDGAFRLEDGTLDHKSFVVNAKGSVYVSDTLGVAGETGKLLLDGAAQQSFTSLGGVIANMEIDNANGIDLLSGDLSIFETLTMTTGVFDINTSKLTMAGASANITGTFSSSVMIQTAGNASDGGLEMYIDANETITFPIGTDANADTRYTPLVAEYSSYSDDGYVSVSPSDDVLATTNGGGGTMLTYYWHVVHQGFSTVPKVTSYTFSGSENDGTGSGAYSGSWRAGKVLSEVPYSRSKEGAGGINNPTDNDINFDGDGTPFDVENADYSAGPSNRFNGSPGVYYSKETDTDGSLNFLPDWSSTSSWVHIDDLIDANSDGNIDEQDYHDGRQPDASAAPGVGDIAIIGFIPWTDDNITYRGAPHHIQLDNTSENCAQLNFTQMTDVSGNPVARNEDRFWAMRPSVIITGGSGQLNADVVNGEGEFFINYGGDPDFSVMDLGNFVKEDSSIVFYEANTDRTYSNAPDEVPNLLLGTSNWGANDRDISFSNDIDINVNLEILGNANLVLSSGATGDLTIDNDLIMFEAAGGVVIPGCCTSGASGGGAQIIYPNSSNARSITVTGDIEMNNAGGLIYVNSPGTTPLSHSLNVYGNITQNTAAGGNDGLLLWTASNSDVIDLNLLGDTSMTFDVTSGDIPELNRLIVNKGTDASTSATINTDFNLNSTTNGATKALELQNGTLILNDAAIDINLTTGGDDFQIPGTSGLQLTQGTVNASGDDSGIWLDGSLIIDGGTVDMDDAINNGNNYIEYSASGTATINISSGSLTVGSQIRRNTVATTGVLNYTQTGGTVVIGKNAAPESNRGVFEVLNTGSDMTFTGGSFTLVRQNGASPTIAALYLAPETSDFTGSTITIGSADTPASQTEFNITALAAFNNMTFAGSNTPTSKLKVLGLLVGGDLTINSGHTLDGNTYNLTLAGDFTNNGVYTANSNVTYFTGGAGTQTYSGSGTETFYDFTKVNTSDLVVAKDLIIANDITLTNGTFDTGTNQITIQGNAEIDLDVSSTSGNGMVFQGASEQFLSRSASGASSIDILTIDNGLGVTIPSSAAYNFTINNKLRLSNGLFSIGSNLLTISEICSITEVNTFTDGNMIHTNSSFTDNGVKKEFPTIGSSTNFTFPVGEAIYTPVVFTILSMDAGSITARPANEMHISIIDDVEAPDPEITDADNALQYHWVVQAEDIISLVGSATFTYDPTDALVLAPEYTLANYIPARLLDGTTNWDKAFSSTNFDEGANTFTVGFASVDNDGIKGVYTAGVGVDDSDVGINGAIPDNIPTYETNSAGGGDYDADATWTTSIPVGGPLGGQITVKNGDDLILNNHGVRLTRTVIESGGTLTVDETTFHRLGTVTGTGVLKIVSSTTNANLPAGYYGDFFACSGGSIEYAGTGNYSIMPSLASVRSLILSGSGDRDLANNDVAICEDLTINGPTFNNNNNRTLTITDELIVTAGTFNSGTGTIDVDGDMTVNGGVFDNETGGLIDIAGTLNLSSGTFNAGSGGAVYLRGNVSYTGGTFTGGSSSAAIRFNGASTQTIAGDFTGTNSFYRVEMYNDISLSNNIEIDNQLTFSSGIMDANANTVTLGSAITVSPAEGLSTSYIDGKVLKTLSSIGDSFTFPIGKNGRWGHASVKSVSVGGETWDAEYFYASPTTHVDVDNITPIAPILTISNGEYWVISDGNGTPSGVTATIGLSWDGLSDVSPVSGEREQLEVMVWNDGASTWDEYGGGTFSGGHTQSAGSFQSTTAVSFSKNIFTLGSTNLLNALPIELLSFKGEALTNTVKLTWETASELNNDFFTLLRSKDGANFEEITTILGAGNSNEVLAYSFIDERPFNGISYYKLMQTDFDGLSTESDIVLVKMLNNSQELKLMSYPNPFSDEDIAVTLSGLNKEENVSIAVFDLYGKQQLLVEHQANGSGYLDIIIQEANSWKSGVYIIMALTEKGAVQTKVIKQ